MTSIATPRRLASDMGIRLVLEGPHAAPEGITYEFDQQRVVIGRSASADVRVPHAAVSELHASIEHLNEGYAVIDQGSTNGTRVNGADVVPHRPRPLRDGDHIEIAGFRLQLRTGVPVTRATTVERTASLARRLVRELVEPGNPAAAPPRLVAVAGPAMGETLEVPPPPCRLRIGRDDACQWTLADEDVSREHVEVARDLDGVSILDLDSKNGIRINERVVRQRRLRDGDEIELGRSKLLFEDPAEEALTALTQQSDAPYRPPSPPENEPAQPTQPRASTSTPSTKQAPHRSGMGADAIIYALAIVVLAVSLLALAALLQGP